MNEAELLCDRIAVLVNGGYSCISNIQDLQRKAAGYNLTIGFHYSEDTSSQKKWVSDTLDSIAKLDYDIILNESRKMSIKINHIDNLSTLYSKMNLLLGQKVVKSYWASNMNLEDIFLNIARHQHG